jgi:hypothetical protein
MVFKIRERDAVRNKSAHLAVDVDVRNEVVGPGL